MVGEKRREASELAAHGHPQKGPQGVGRWSGPRRPQWPGKASRVTQAPGEAVNKHVRLLALSNLSCPLRASKYLSASLRTFVQLALGATLFAPASSNSATVLCVPINGLNLTFTRSLLHTFSKRLLVKTSPGLLRAAH